MHFPVMRLMAQYHSARQNDQGLAWFLKLLKASAAKT